MIEKLGSFKIEGWEKKLATMLWSKRDQPFKWGEHDCMTLACDSIKTMTGFDPMAGWARGKYSTKHEAIDIVRGHFGLCFIDTFSELFYCLGFQVVTEVGRGDIAFVKVKNLDEEASELFGGVTLATVFADKKGKTGFICPGKAGLVVLKEFELRRAWKL